MATPYISEIKIFMFDWPPRSWALCDGQSIPISQNQSLYSLLGTAYGGNNQTAFNLPDLRGRTPVHLGQNNSYSYTRGQHGGLETVTLSPDQLASHTHTVTAALDNGEFDPSYDGAYFSSGIDGKTDEAASVYRSATNLINLNDATVSHTGGSQPHNNLQPSLVLSFCMALQGMYPGRN